MHLESIDLHQGTSIPPYCPDSQFEESAWWSTSPQNSINCSFYHCYPQELLQNLLIICWVMARFLIGQSAWWCQSVIKSNQLFLFYPRPTLKISLQPIITLWVVLLADKQTERQANKQTNATKKIISSAEIIKT